MINEIANFNENDTKWKHLIGKKKTKKKQEQTTQQIDEHRFI